MDKKFRILFVVPAGYGHINPTLAIIKNLKTKGHIIGYCSGSNVQDVILKAGVDYFYSHDTINNVGLKIVVYKGYEIFNKFAEYMTYDIIKQSIRDMISAIESFRPDVIYIDTLFSFLHVIADQYNIPYVDGNILQLKSNIFDIKIPPPGSGWDRNKPWSNIFKLIPYSMVVTRSTLKIVPRLIRAMRDFYPDWKIKQLKSISPYLLLYYATDRFEYPRKKLPPQIFFVGPVILTPDEDQLPPFPWDKIDRDRPLIYIATGTFFNFYYKELYPMVFKALSDDSFPIPVQVVIAAGNQQNIDDFGKIPSNFIVVPFAPQVKLVQQASVVIHHGGTSTTYESLLYGKPMFVVYFGNDSMDLAGRVKYNGSGITCNVKNITTEKIRNSVIQLLENPEYRKRCEFIQDSFKKCDGINTSAELIIHLADTGKPLIRKKGAPVTLDNIKYLPDYLEK